MRAIVFVLSMILAFTSPTSAAKLKSEQDFYKESESYYRKAVKEKDFSQKVSYLKNLKKSFEATLDEYEKKNPKEGNDQEQDIARLYYTLEPVFEAVEKKKPSDIECAQQQQTIKTHDSIGKPDGAPQGPRAKEALRWMEILCK